MLEGVFAAFPDFHVEPGPLRHGDDHVLVECLFSGTQALDWNDIPSSGRHFHIRTICIYEFEHDVLVREQVFYDLADMARQLTGDT